MANDEIENKRKATEIAQSVSFFWTNEDDAEKSIIDTTSLRKAIFNASLQAMEWKKQQVIERTCDTIKHLLGGYVIQNFNFGDSYDTDRLIDDLIKELNKE